jgi:hypothetical protein
MEAVPQFEHGGGAEQLLEEGPGGGEEPDTACNTTCTATAATATAARLLVISGLRLLVIFHVFGPHHSSHVEKPHGAAVAKLQQSAWCGLHARILLLTAACFGWHVVRDWSPLAVDTHD